MEQSSNPNREERKRLIDKISTNDNPVFAEKYKTQALNSLIEDLEDSINRNSKESGKLSTVMVWLTFVIAIATILLAIIGGTDLWFKIKTLKQTNNISNISTELKK